MRKKTKLEVPKKRKPKLRSKKTLVNGILFDSEMEAQYYEYLLELQSKGKIAQIILQPHKTLVEAFEKYGKRHRKAIYTPDFLVYYPDGSHVYIEIKGFSRPDADLRRKIFDAKYPDTLIWLTGYKKVNGRWTEWLPYDDVKKIRAQRRKEKKNAVSS